MTQIDFLPARFRQETVHRKANFWRILVAGLFTAALLASAVYQQLLRRGTERDLARVGLAYDQAQAVAGRLADLQGRLREADAQAELLTYLRHPWPSSQVLAAALAPLPDCLTLDEIHLAHDQPSSAEHGMPFIAAPQHGATAGGAADKKQGTPAQRALAQLRKECDHRPVVLTLSGLTSDTASLQRYLVTLGEAPLLGKVELTSLEARTGDHSDKLHFTARLVVRPGCGQPGGPTAPHDDKTAGVATTNPLGGAPQAARPIPHAD